MDVRPDPIGAAPERSGCLIALYAILGAGLLMLVVGGVATWLFLQTEEGQEIFSATARGFELVSEASQGPGTAELRDAGCDVALVPNMAEAVDVIRAFLSDEENAKLKQQLAGQDLDQTRLLLCVLPRDAASEPSCPDLARTYADAVPDVPEALLLAVIRQGSDTPGCAGLYAPDGSLIEDAD